MSLQRTAQLIGFTVNGIDGDVGSIADILFDDESWRIRYLAVRSGGWLDQRTVLVAPHTLVSADVDARVIHVPLSQEQIRHSQTLDTDPPLYRQHELQRRAETPPLWTTYGGMYEPSMLSYASLTYDAWEHERQSLQEADFDPHLRSAQTIQSYRVESATGELGHVVDLILDDEDWMLRYVVIETGQWFAKQRVLVPTRQVDEISWERRTLVTELSQEQLAASPAYTEALLGEPGFEARLLSHYLGANPVSLAELRGMPVVEVERGRLLGTIDDVYLDPDGRRCEAVVLRSGGVLDQREFVLPMAELQVLGEDVWLARNGSALFTAAQYEQQTGNVRARRLRGRPVTTEGGTPLGELGYPLLRADGSVQGFALRAVQVKGPLAERRSIARSALSVFGDESQPATTTLSAAEGSPTQ